MIDDVIALERVACPKCGSDDHFTIIKGKDRLHDTPGAYFVTECRRCGLWFQNPRPHSEHVSKLYPTHYAAYTQPVLGKYHSLRPDSMNYLRQSLGYAHVSADQADQPDWRALPPLDLLRKWQMGAGLVPRYVPGGKLLEVGCGSGTRLLTLRNIGWEHLYGIELSPEAVAIARANGFSVEAGLVEDTIDIYPDNYFDVIISSKVFEHLFNPFETVRRLAAKLKPGGQFLFSTVCRDGLDALIYDTDWRNLDLPRHMVLFRKKDIQDMLAEQFEGVELFFQATPIDFVGSARYRQVERRSLVDRALVAVGEARLKYISFGLALLGRTSRISVRCIRKRGS